MKKATRRWLLLVIQKRIEIFLGLFQLILLYIGA